jgi:cyclophilin family peptidyl-prolyl cis-trans isomerase
MQHLFAHFSEAHQPATTVAGMAKRPEMQIDLDTIYQVTLDTERGEIVMELDPHLAPETVNNFIGLARTGYYDNLTFHRVVPEFVIQGGDPDGTGGGGPGYTFKDEPVKGDYTLGAVAMANRGSDTNGSQFFICIEDCRRKLDKKYNLFGYVTDGVDVAQKIKVGDHMKSVTITERASD